MTACLSKVYVDVYFQVTLSTIFWTLSSLSCYTSYNTNVYFVSNHNHLDRGSQTHVLGRFLAGREQAPLPLGPGSWYAGGDFLRRSYGLWWPGVEAAAAAGTGGEPPPPPLPLGPAHAAVAAIALPGTLLGHGTDSHGSAERKLG